jgi:hypothetical protein
VDCRIEGMLKQRQPFIVPKSESVESGSERIPRGLPRGMRANDVQDRFLGEAKILRSLLRRASIFQDPVTQKIRSREDRFPYRPQLPAAVESRPGIGRKAKEIPQKKRNVRGVLHV